MADDKKLEILISTKGDASGAQQVTDALKETAEAAKAAANTGGTGGANDAWKAEHDARMAALDKEREAKEKVEKADERTARNTDNMDMRGKVENAAQLARGLEKAANTARDFADAMESSNPAMAETARKTADVADGLGSILGGAAQGFAAGGPVGAALATIGSAAMYAFNGLQAEAKATEEMEAALLKANNASAEAERLAAAKARESAKAAEAAYDQKAAEEKLTEALEKQREALRGIVEQTREKIALTEEAKGDHSEVARLEADAKRAAVKAGSGSEEEKARQLAAIDAAEKARVRQIEDAALQMKGEELGAGMYAANTKAKDLDYSAGIRRDKAAAMPKGEERQRLEDEAKRYEEEAEEARNESRRMRREQEALLRDKEQAGKTRPLVDKADNLRAEAEIRQARERDEARKEQEARRKEQEEERAAREATRAETQGHTDGANAQTAAKGARDAAGVKGMPAAARKQLEAAAAALEDGAQGDEMAKVLAMVERLADLATASKNTSPEVKRALASLEAKVAKLDSQAKANRS